MKHSRATAPLLPTIVCAWCSGVVRKGNVKLSHGICRPCRERFFGKQAAAAASMLGLLPRRRPA
jgi:hypothetical protein